jgi:putative hydrolase of the HAD superfamily
MRTILWDFDGTLAYRNGMWTDTLLSVLRKNGHSHVRKDEIRPYLSIGFAWNSPDTPHAFSFKGKTWWEHHEGYFQEIFRRFGIDGRTALTLAGQVRAEYSEIGKWQSFEDAAAALEALQGDYQNAILSNHIPELEDIVRGLGLRGYFKAVFSSGNIGYEKPNAMIYDYAVNAMGIDRNECVMIGDSYEADVAGALRSGMKAILVRKPNVKEYGWYAESLGPIRHLIDSLMDRKGHEACGPSEE